MHLLPAFASFLVLLNASCAFVDFILPIAYKQTIHFRLVSWWYRVSEIEVKDYPIFVAQQTVALFRKILGPTHWSWRALSISVVFSLALTTLALAFGLWLKQRDTDPITFVSNYFLLFGPHMPGFIYI